MDAGAEGGRRTPAAGRVFAAVAQAERVALGLIEDHVPPLVPPHVERMTIKELEEFMLGRAEARR